MRIAIFGLAKSGTTALFYRIQGALGDAPSWVPLFEPRRLPHAYPDDQRILAKLLIGPPGYADYQPFLEFSHPILIIRDPRDTLISRVLYNIFEVPPQQPEAGIRAFREKLALKQQNLRQVSLKELVRDMLRLLFPERSRADRDFPCDRFLLDFAGGGFRWQEDLRSRFPGPEPLLVLYETMVAGELATLEAFLGMSLSGQGDVAPAHRRVARTCASGEWVSWFLPQDAAFFGEAFQPWSEYYPELGEPDSWSNDLPRGSLPVATTTAYLDRILYARKERLGLA